MPDPAGAHTLTSADALVRQFQRLVQRDGARLQLLGIGDGVVTVGYVPGVDPTCGDGSCVLPEAELQQMMAETLGRRDPSLRVEVVRLPPSGGPASLDPADHLAQRPAQQPGGGTSTP